MPSLKNSAMVNAIKPLQTKREVDKGGGIKFQKLVSEDQSKTDTITMHIYKNFFSGIRIENYFSNRTKINTNNTVQKEKCQIKTGADKHKRKCTKHIYNDISVQEKQGYISPSSSKARISHGILRVTFLVAVFCTIISAVAARRNHFPSSRNGLWGDHKQSCPMAFHEIGGRCYFYGYFPLNWFRASEFCHSFGQGVSLASIETAQENYHIKQWLMVNGDHNTGVWIGGSDNGHEGRWAWFPTGQLIDYSNWGPSQPSGDDQHCMYMVGGILGYQWADFHCEFNMNFLCEHGVNDAQPWR